MREPELISITATASRLGVSVATVRRLVTEGRMPSVKVGAQIRIATAVVDAYVARARGEQP